VAIALGSAVGVVVSYVATGRKEMVRRHAARLGVAPEDLDAHVRAVFAGYGRYWAEALWVRPRRSEEVLSRTSYDGLERVIAARDAAAGIVFALPHMGNWELAIPIADMIGIHAVAVAENLANTRIRDWFVRMREEMGVGIVLATGAAQVMRQLEAEIAAVGTVALLCDRDLRGRGVEVEFFGERTTLPAGPASLAMRTGAPIFPVATYFDGVGHKVVIRPAITVPDKGDRSTRIAVTTQRLAKELEVLIRAAPEQWHLLQPNWPTDHRAPE